MVTSAQTMPTFFSTTFSFGEHSRERVFLLLLLLQKNNDLGLHNQTNRVFLLLLLRRNNVLGLRNQAGRVFFFLGAVAKNGQCFGFTQNKTKFLLQNRVFGCKTRFFYQAGGGML